MDPQLLSIPTWAHKWQRQGLVCNPKLPAGAEVMEAPPVVDSLNEILDPRAADDTKLREWAQGPALGYYSQYAVVRSSGKKLEGVPVLAGNDVSKKKFKEFTSAARHLLVDAAKNASMLTSLARHGVRILVAGTRRGAWRRHPEVKTHFDTGLGGGAPWFPSTGIQADEESNSLLEEIFHTIQYVVMKPRDVCMYHKAYADAVVKKLYTTDGSGPEDGGEPVPTVQADEYFAMALQRWLGSGEGLKEYRVRGNSDKPRMETGRERLRKLDPQAFCLLAKEFRSDDTWNPRPLAKPWKNNPNRAMNIEEVAGFCEPILATLAKGCPVPDLNWPHDAIHGR
jgi:hypothetical protein